MESGDIEHAYRALAASCLLAMAGGFPLGDIEANSKKLFDQMTVYRVDSMRLAFVHVLLAIQYMTGSMTAPLDWDEIKNAIPSGNLNTSECTYWRYYCWSYVQLAYFFQEYGVAGKLVGPFEKLAALDAASYKLTSIRVFYTGLVATALARQTGKRKWKVVAQKQIKKMKWIMNQRGLNNLHRYILIQADLLSLEKHKNIEKVKEWFDKGIAAAGRAGFTQDAAIGNELAGEYCLSMGDVFWASHYFTRSYELYSEWGLKIKVDYLKDVRGEYIDFSKKKVRGRKSTLSSVVRDWTSGDSSLIHKSVNWDMLSTISDSLTTNLSATLQGRRVGTSLTAGSLSGDHHL